MSENMNHRDLDTLAWLKRWFKKPVIVDSGDIGIYHYVWACDTYQEDSHGLKYDVFAKIKAVTMYENLVEIEAVDIKINDSASVDIQNIIKNNFPKYVNPKYVRWQVKKPVLAK